MAGAALSIVLDSRGSPVPSEVIARVRSRGASAALDGGTSHFFPYDAAQWQTVEMGDWLPSIRSPDNEINIYRDRMVARARDLVRNDGWASGAITRILDSTIGSSYRLSAIPDYRALSAIDKAFDKTWANEFQSAVESLWRGFADDDERYFDVQRQLSASQMFRLSLRHKLVDGESLVLPHWMPDRVGSGRAKFATCFLLVDPDRLSNPYGAVDSKNLRGGVEIDDDGVPRAYHIRKAEQNDWYNVVESMEWERVDREDPDGWRRVIHDFDRERAGQNRGVSVFAPIIARLKMLARYYGVKLQAETVSSVFGTYVTSPFDQQMIQDALDTDDKSMGWYQNLRKEWANNRPAMLNGARVASLAPGEDIKTISGKGTGGEFSAFTHEMLRGLAAVLGVSAEQITWDYSETNYSAARAGIVESEKTFIRRIADFNANTAGPIYSGWLWEAMDRRLLPGPKSRIDLATFLDARAAFTRCRWLGPPRGWVDPVDERQGEILGLAARFSNHEEVCARQGKDWREEFDQQAIEAEYLKSKDLSPPILDTKGGQDSDADGKSTAKSRNKEKAPAE